jgi:hypothetical protein
MKHHSTANPTRDADRTETPLQLPRRLPTSASALICHLHAALSPPQPSSTCGPIQQRTTSTSSTVEALAGRAGCAAGRRSRPSRTRSRSRRWPSAAVASRRRRGPRASPLATRRRSLNCLPHCSTPASTPPTTPSGSAPGCPSPTRSSAPDAPPSRCAWRHLMGPLPSPAAGLGGGRGGGGLGLPGGQS